MSGGPHDMTPDQRLEYLGLIHAIQSGVAALMHYTPSLVEGKHLRVGVDSALVSHAALLRVLFAKGVLTPPEYYEALLAECRAEVARSEAALSEITGAKITLS